MARFRDPARDPHTNIDTVRLTERCMSMSATIQFLDTPDGTFGILTRDGSVIASGWTESAEHLLARLAEKNRPTSVVDGDTGQAADAVRAFYGGDLAAIMAVPVTQSGTTLQHAGWQALRTIAPGTPLTYSEFAVHLGSPSAVRAAASICARNAPALFVPCHRVLRSDGTMGGFAWGVAVKESLLAREAAAA